MEINKGSFLGISVESSSNTASTTFGLTANTRVETELTTSLLSLLTLTEKLPLSFSKWSSSGELTKTCELLNLFLIKPEIIAVAILPAPIKPMFDIFFFNSSHQKC